MKMLRKSLPLEIFGCSFDFVDDKRSGVAKRKMLSASQPRSFVGGFINEASREARRERLMIK